MAKKAKEKQENPIEIGLWESANKLCGSAHEYFFSKFALVERKRKGEFYTPKSIVNLIAKIIEPYKGIIYDPVCGSGGTFAQSIKFIERVGI